MVRDVPNYALHRLLCAKAASAINAVNQFGAIPDARLMAAVEAKLAYLQGEITLEELESYRAGVDDVRLKALARLVNLQSVGGSELARAVFFAAEAATCAATEPVYPNAEDDDVDDPLLEQMLEDYLSTGRTTLNVVVVEAKGDSI